MRKALPLWKGQSGATSGDFPRPARRFADLLVKPRLSRAPIPKETKGEPIPRSLNCLSIPTAQLAHISGCWASAMLPRSNSRCRLSSGKSDHRRMKPSTMDHQLSSQGLPGDGTASSLSMVHVRIVFGLHRHCWNLDNASDWLMKIYSSLPAYTTFT